MPGDLVRLIVADDEPLARRLVRRYVAHLPDVEILCECADGNGLEEALARDHGDAALLDIRMPGRDLFEVLEESARRAPLPSLIFATAYDRYAVRAFELNAVDYLVKPFSEARFAEALDRVRDRRRAGSPHAGDITCLLRDLGRRPERLLVPDGDRILPLLLSDVSWIQAEGSYVRIHTHNRSYLVYRTLTELETRLDPTAFLRVHRSAIVRLDQIAEVRHADSGRQTVILADGTRLTVTRGKAPALKKLML